MNLDNTHNPRCCQSMILSTNSENCAPHCSKFPEINPKELGIRNILPVLTTPVKLKRKSSDTVSESEIFLYKWSDLEVELFVGECNSYVSLEYQKSEDIRFP